LNKPVNKFVSGRNVAIAERSLDVVNRCSHLFRDGNISHRISHLLCSHFAGLVNRIANFSDLCHGYVKAPNVVQLDFP
jgi:hypothetical protein